MLDDPNDLLARILIRDPHETHQAIVHWAGLALERGDDSRSLRVLAGCDSRSDFDDIEELFRRACDELGIDEVEKHNVIRRFAARSCRAIVDGTMPPRSGLCTLLKIRDWMSGPIPELDCLVPLMDELQMLESALSEVLDDPGGLHFVPGPDDWDPEGLQIDRRDSAFVVSWVHTIDLNAAWLAASKVGLGRFEQKVRDTVASIRFHDKGR